MSKYEIKNIKTFRGREGIGFNASLYRDGKKVALVDDSANGGCYDWHWLDCESPRMEVTYKTYKGESYTRKVSPEQARLIEFLKAEGKDGQFEFEDSYVGSLVDKYEETKQFKRWCKDKTVFRVKGDKDGEWRTLKGKYSEEMKRAITTKYGNKLETILNEQIN